MDNYLPVAKVLLILLVALIVYRSIRSIVGRRLVFEYQVGLLYRDGKLVRQLPPGAHWINKLFDYIEIVDTRATTTTIGAQEVVSADKIGLKLSVTARYKVIDAQKYVHDHISSFTELYTLIQLATRNATAAASAEELLEKRKEIGESLLAEVRKPAAALGIEVESVEIKDIMFPAEIRKIFSEVVRAQKEGLAALERARGEQAALRNLANAARTLENNPALMNLRILQTFSSKSADGVAPNIVLGMPQGLYPLSSSAEKTTD